MVHRSSPIRITLYAGCLLLAMTLTAGAADRPNIILCMGDDHGWEETGYNGHPYLQTPVLDDMAAAGLRMDHFYAAHPSCSPTRGSVITGRHPNRYGTFTPNCSIRPEEISVAQILKDAGYACGHFGKWHLGPVKADSPTNPGAMGFDAWLSHDNFFEINPTFSRNGGPPERFEGESSALTVAEAIRFMENATQAGNPFFVVVWFGSPHEPYSGLEQDLALYDDLPEAYAKKKTRLTSIATGQQVERPLDAVLQERFAEITAMDRAMGTLRRYLKAEGLKENTLLWYCGDNGTPGGVNVASPFRGAKNRVYEGGIRVPGIIEWPAGIPEPRISTVNTVTSDILPTLCDLVELPLPERPLDGISLKPLIEGAMTSRTQPICFWKYTIPGSAGELSPYIAPEQQQGTTPLVKLMNGIPTRNFRNYHQTEITTADYAGPRAILGDRYKLVIDGDEEQQETKQLFDIRKDPAEANDLADSHPEMVTAMEQQLRQWQGSVLNSLLERDYH